MTEVLIVGAGLTGLFASLLAAEHGEAVTIVAQGHGGLGLCHGCLDIWGRATPSRAISRLRDSHPYRLAGTVALHSAVEFFGQITQQANYPFSGSASRNLRLPTALGSIHSTALAPQSLAQGDLDDQTPFALAGIDNLRDFYPQLAASNLHHTGITVQSVLELPIPLDSTHNDFSTSDLAQLFDQTDWREEVSRIWKPHLTGIKRLGLPAVLGLHDPHHVLEDMQERLGVTLFEIPTLPPSLPGLRLEIILRREALNTGVHLIEGPRAIGRIDGRSKGRRVSGVVLQTAGGPRIHTADVVILATGGILNGGLVFQQDGSVQEAVFDIPVNYDEGRHYWTTTSPIDSQPYSGYGILVNDHLEPLGAKGTPIFNNLYAAGGLLGGADRTMEGSRQGIDLATAYRAVEVALG
jgi:glycerol-3-phosphate dehydrogenase subunit B